MPSTHPLVSILINNYNYGRFLRAAIDSALKQSYPHIEVIVVDDGSTDDSWNILQTYSTRIRSIQQANCGQGAAYNAGFAASRGDWVLFLDSDDELDPDAIASCMSSVAINTSKVQFFLRLVDRNGAPLGGRVPYRMHDGDVTLVLQRFGHYAGPPGSGNLYRRSAIAPYFPMPSEQWRRAADTIPFLASACHGRVVTLPREMGNYRLHVHSASSGVFGNMNKSLRDALISDHERGEAAVQWLAACGNSGISTARLSLPSGIRARALSWKLDRAHHPYSTDTARSLWRDARLSIRHWPGYSLLERGALLLWVGATLIAPAWLAQKFSATHVSAGIKSWVRRFAGSAR